MGRTAAREHAVARMGEADAEDPAVVLAAHLLRRSARVRRPDGTPVANGWVMAELLTACRSAATMIAEIQDQPKETQ